MIGRTYRTNLKNSLNNYKAIIEKIADKRYLKTRILCTDVECCMDIRYKSGKGQIRLYIDIMVVDDLVLTNAWKEKFEYGKKHKSFNYFNADTVDYETFKILANQWIEKAKEKIDDIFIMTYNPKEIEKIIDERNAEVVKQLPNYEDYDIFDCYEVEPRTSAYTLGSKVKEYYLCFQRKKYSVNKHKRLLVVPNDISRIADISYTNVDSAYYTARKLSAVDYDEVKTTFAPGKLKIL